MFIERVYKATTPNTAKMKDLVASGVIPGRNRFAEAAARFNETQHSIQRQLPKAQKRLKRKMLHILESSKNPTRATIKAVSKLPGQKPHEQGPMRQVVSAINRADLKPGARGEGYGFHVPRRIADQGERLIAAGPPSAIDVYRGLGTSGAVRRKIAQKPSGAAMTKGPSNISNFAADPKVAEKYATSMPGKRAATVLRAPAGSLRGLEYYTPEGQQFITRQSLQVQGAPKADGKLLRRDVRGV